MNRLLSSIKKEWLILRTDIVGMLFMFAMPLLLVFVLTIVQDSAFRRINDNQIRFLVVNHDNTDISKNLITLIEAAGMFDVQLSNTIEKQDIKTVILKKNIPAALYIPKGFSEQLNKKTDLIGSSMLAEMGLFEQEENLEKFDLYDLDFFHDPVLQEAYCYTIISMIKSYLTVIENELLLENIYAQLGIEKKSGHFKETMSSNSVNITQTAASHNNIKPNSTQHNVPAWTIFAMFFMVVSLGNNIVKERLNGSFIRLKTMPINFTIIFGSKMFVYVAVAITQVVFIFSIGMLLFPLIGLPKLTLPNNILLLFAVVIITAISAVSYSIMIGSLAKTQEQANGIGAVSIIIFAALGGIFVPVFVMPDLLSTIGKFSPLYWYLEAFYFLFLKGGNWVHLWSIILPMLIFIFICNSISYLKLKMEKII